MPGESSANHHLWLNRRTWWIAFTVLHDGYRQERVRRSLGTRDLPVARLRRDAIMRTYANLPGVALAVRVPRGATPEPTSPCC